MMTFFGTGFASFDGLPATARCVWGEAAVETHARTMTTPVVLEDSHVVCSSAPVSGFSGAYYFVSAKLALNGIEYGVPVSAPPSTDAVFLGRSHLSAGPDPHHRAAPSIVQHTSLALLTVCRLLWPMLCSNLFAIMSSPACSLISFL